MTEVVVEIGPEVTVDPRPTLRVNEIFYSFQGEGPSTGHAAVFLRLSGCNLDCAWCDTPYTWDWRGKNGVAYDQQAETHLWPVAQLASVLDPELRRAPLLVITGGEPLLQQRSIVDLVDCLRTRGVQARIEVETNGTRPPVEGLRGRVYFNVSPKLPSAHTTADPIHVPALVELAKARSIFKFVVVDIEADISAVEIVLHRAGNIRPRQVWLMPEGRDRETIEAGLALLAEPARKRGWNLSGRMHVTMWGDQRGR
jgi:organic radical activating enzyme